MIVKRFYVGCSRTQQRPGPGSSTARCYYDVALRDFGLLVGALALWRLASRRR